MADDLKGVPELCAHVLRSVETQSWEAFSVARSTLWLIAITLGHHIRGGVPRTERDPGFARLLQRFDEGERPLLGDINAWLCVGNSDLFEAELNRRSWRILPNAREARRISKALGNLESLVPHDDLPEPDRELKVVLHAWWEDHVAVRQSISRTARQGFDCTLLAHCCAISLTTLFAVGRTPLILKIEQEQETLDAETFDRAEALFLRLCRGMYRTSLAFEGPKSLRQLKRIAVAYVDVVGEFLPPEGHLRAGLRQLLGREDRVRRVLSRWS